MIRLNSGTYLMVPGFASAIPFNISGTNCFGSLTNFFIGRPSRQRWTPGSQTSASCSAIIAMAIEPASYVPQLRSPVYDARPRLATHGLISSVFCRATTLAA